MIFFIISVASIIFTIVLGIQKNYAYVKTKEYFNYIIIFAIVIGLLSGLIEGTWYSHGLDIPWWVFSILNFLLLLITAVVIIGLTHILFRKTKNTNK